MSFYTISVVIALCFVIGLDCREPQSLTNVGSGASGISGTRAGLVLSPRAARYRARLAPPGPGDRFIIEDDDIIELSKKQMDDYGHMRFGKREDQFDDYGHLRFGRGDVD